MHCINYITVKGENESTKITDMYVMVYLDNPHNFFFFAGRLKKKKQCKKIDFKEIVKLPDFFINRHILLLQKT